jgi:3-methyladenine DNA glycosylase AlkD
MSTKNRYHAALLASIKKKSGKATQHTFNDSYLGNSHPRYAINSPILRQIAKSWMSEHKSLLTNELVEVLTTLIQAPSSTEKCLAGIMMDYATKDQRTFDPIIFDSWLNHLIGWAEVDTVCTGKYTVHEIPSQWSRWKRILIHFSKDKNIQKKRASLVLLCAPLRKNENTEIAVTALAIIKRLMHEREVLVTKAISWLLRSMIKHHKSLVNQFVEENKTSLPAIAVREVMTVLKTGKKTKTRV